MSQYSSNLYKAGCETKSCQEAAVYMSSHEPYRPPNLIIIDLPGFAKPIHRLMKPRAEQDRTTSHDKLSRAERTNCQNEPDIKPEAQEVMVTKRKLASEDNMQVSKKPKLGDLGHNLGPVYPNESNADAEMIKTLKQEVRDIKTKYYELLTDKHRLQWSLEETERRRAAIEQTATETQEKLSTTQEQLSQTQEELSSRQDIVNVAHARLNKVVGHVVSRMHFNAAADDLFKEMTGYTYSLNPRSQSDMQYKTVVKPELFRPYTEQLIDEAELDRKLYQTE